MIMMMIMTHVKMILLLRSQYMFGLLSSISVASNSFFGFGRTI